MGNHINNNNNKNNVFIHNSQVVVMDVEEMYTIFVYTYYYRAMKKLLSPIYEYEIYLNENFLG